MRRAPRNAPLWIVLGAAVVVLGAIVSTNVGGHRAVKAVSLEVVPSEVPPPVDAVTGDPASESALPLVPPSEEAPTPSVVTATPSEQQVAFASPEPVGSAGMVVGIDPETGKLGMPSREFRDALAASRENPALSRSMEGLQVIHRPDGSRMVDLRGRFQEYAVIRITPDGRKEQTCVQGPEVEAALQGTTSASTTGAGDATAASAEAEAASPNAESGADSATESRER